MKTGSIVAIGGVVVVVVFTLILAMWAIGTSNREIELRTLIEQKQRDNTSEYDNMWKKISQVAQVTQAQKDALKDIFVSYAQARQTGGDDQIMTWIKESCPNVDVGTFSKLQDIIVSSRDTFTFRQKELLDYKREHDLVLRRFPSCVLMNLFGRRPIDVTIVTSSKSEKAFETGKDDDVKLFESGD